MALWAGPGVGSALASTSPPAGSWLWPVSGPVLRGFEPPPTPFSAGHRGIDIGADFGTPVRAAADGTVTFAGPVGGSLFVTIDHGDGYRSTSSFLSKILVRRGQPVTAGEVVALSGRGHPEIPTPQLHFGVRLNGDYVDPLPLLQPQSVVDLIRLAPLEDSGGSSPPGAGRAGRPRAGSPFRALSLADRMGAVWWQFMSSAGWFHLWMNGVVSARGPPHVTGP